MLERRGLVTDLLTVLSSVIGAVVGIPLVGYMVLPALNKRPEVFEKQALYPVGRRYERSALGGHGRDGSIHGRAGLCARSGA